MKEELQLN